VAGAKLFGTKAGKDNLGDLEGKRKERKALRGATKSNRRLHRLCHQGDDPRKHPTKKLKKSVVKPWGPEEIRL